MLETIQNKEASWVPDSLEFGLLKAGIKIDITLESQNISLLHNSLSRILTQSNEKKNYINEYFRKVFPASVVGEIISVIEEYESSIKTIIDEISEKELQNIVWSKQE